MLHGRIQEEKRKMHNTSTYVGLRHPKGQSEPYGIISGNLIHVMSVSSALAHVETLSANPRGHCRANGNRAC